MSDRVHLAKVAVDSMLPGWSFWQLGGETGGENDLAVVQRCAHCKDMGMLTKHSISPSGEVNASIFCCEPGHIFAILDDWPPHLEKKAGAVNCTRVEGK